MFVLIHAHYLRHFDAITALGHRKSAPHIKTNLFKFAPLYELFYAPYAEKLWACDPAALSFEPAEQRMQRKFPREIVRNGLRREKKFFYYPAGAGFG